MLVQWRRGNGVLQGTCVGAFREKAKKRERQASKMCTCKRGCAFVCACAKAWKKKASQTVIFKTMCQLTEQHTLHCTQAFLQSGLSVYFSCNEGEVQFTTATLNLHCRTSCLPQQPDTPRRHWPHQLHCQFLLNLQNIPVFLIHNHFSGDKRS